MNVEIANKIRHLGDVVDEIDLKPLTDEQKNRKLHPDEEAPLSEADSLVKTGHIKLIN